MDDSERAPYEAMAEEDKKRYNEQMKECAASLPFLLERSIRETD